MANWTKRKHDTKLPMWLADDQDAYILLYGGKVYALYERGSKGIKSHHPTLGEAQAAHP